MPSTKPLRLLLDVLILSFCLAGTASADLVALSRTGSASGQPWTLSPEQNLAVSWSQTFTLNNVVIHMFNLGIDGGSMDLNVYLRSGSVTGTGVATATASLSGEVADLPLVWSDPTPLTLGPGSYFLVAVPQQPGVWRGGNDAGTAISGASFGSDYYGVDPDFIPNPLNLGFQVSGDLDGAGEIPEPATWTLMGAGLLLGGILRRRRA